jgi:hypothetical protein
MCIIYATDEKNSLLQEVIATRDRLAELNRYSAEEKWKDMMDILSIRQGLLG